MTIDLAAINAERERIKADYLQDAADRPEHRRADCTTSRSSAPTSSRPSTSTKACWSSLSPRSSRTATTPAPTTSSSTSATATCWRSSTCPGLDLGPVRRGARRAAPPRDLGGPGEVGPPARQASTPPGSSTWSRAGRRSTSATPTAPGSSCSPTRSGRCTAPGSVRATARPCRSEATTSAGLRWSSPCRDSLARTREHREGGMSRFRNHRIPGIWDRSCADVYGRCRSAGSLGRWVAGSLGRWVALDWVAGTIEHSRTAVGGHFGVVGYGTTGSPTRLSVKVIRSAQGRPGRPHLPRRAPSGLPAGHR